MAKEMVRPLRRWRIDLLGGRTRKEIFFSLEIIIIIYLRDFYHGALLLKTKQMVDGEALFVASQSKISNPINL